MTIETNLDSTDVDGIIDDLPKDESIQTPEKDETKELIGGLQDQITLLNTELTSAKATKGERDEIINRFSSAVGFIEGSGLGKYNEETGAIEKIQQVPQGPDPLQELSKDIAKEEASLKKEFNNGDLTKEEYYLKVQENISPLKDKYRDMQFDKKLKTEIDKVKTDLTPKEIKQSEKVETNTYQAVKDKYDDMAKEFPGITDTNSDLYKKMNDIYVKNSNIYKNANCDNGKGDPSQYKDLIERAIVSLKADGIDIQSEKTSIRNRFQTPGNKGYQEKKASNEFLTSDDKKNLVSQGISSKSLIGDINKNMAAWSQTGSVEIED